MIDRSLARELKLPLLSLPRNVEEPDLSHQLQRASVPEFFGETRRSDNVLVGH